MAQTFTGRKRVRKVFGHVKEVGEMPNLIEVQKASYDQFLIMQAPKGGRANEGLQSVFKSVFPISDFAQTAQLEFVKYEYEPPKYDVDECRQRGMTYAAPLKVTLRLIVFDVDPETQAKSVKDIKEQDVYMGDMPLMTTTAPSSSTAPSASSSRRCTAAPACSSTTTRARAIRRASCCSPRASFPIAARGSTSSSTRRTSYMRASTAAAKFP